MGFERRIRRYLQSDTRDIANPDKLFDTKQNPEAKKNESIGLEKMTI